MHISITTPVVSAFVEAPAGILNHFWFQVAVLLLKPPHCDFRSETAVT